MLSIPGNSVIREFEYKIAEYCGVNYALSVCNATMGIMGVFYALGLAGKEIITTPLTWPGAISGLIALNCKLKFCDVEPGTLTINPEKAEHLITPKTRAIFTADFLGYPARLNKIRIICDKHNLWLIHDAASSFGSRYKGKYSGHDADVTILSFGATKVFTTGEGGSIITDNKEVREKVVHCLSHPERQDMENGYANPFAWNTRINPFAADFGIKTFEEQIEKIELRKRWFNKWLKNNGLEAANSDFQPNYYKILVAPEHKSVLDKKVEISFDHLPFQRLIYNEACWNARLSNDHRNCQFAEWALENYRVCNLPVII